VLIRATLEFDRFVRIAEKNRVPSREKISKLSFPKNPRAFVIAAVILLILGMLAFSLSPNAPLHLSKDEALFPSIHMPPQAVYGMGYMDGGSVAVIIVDRLDTNFELTFPINYDGIRNAHPTAFFGNMNDPKK
jgi:hypothetical protein